MVSYSSSNNMKLRRPVP